LGFRPQPKEHPSLKPQTGWNEIMSRVIEADFFPHASEAIRNKPRILIVDDNHDFTRSAKLVLEKTGRYFVFEENDATKAHQTAQDLEPDLILLDVAMPETDGGEVAARIQSDPVLHQTPIVFLTALVTKDETRSGLHIQGHSFLAKPISFSDLIEGIDENLPVRAAS
jgi:CheY-like chemotaxis protein